ncbi:hypothetical protein BKA67DRAFT_59465 [Truncatella angustata]|uniref:DNA polymerase epsilon subunit D n=1 Tax=Truncatella angustata TaxID=152316 RepID=A0A9P8UYB8_9PEZI|nr:uncharacterized protein BKA67DRAFT_59465 [Truncatella angustata]KAH6660613.1 hypothetical protein BKA67DRAFT_59465 [Truncatella angustata]
MPRKSDTSRRSDVSMARSALAEGTAANADPRPDPPATPADATAPVADTTEPHDPISTEPQEASEEVDMERASESAAPSDKRDRGDTVGIEDLNLPKSIITRLAKGVLPPNTQIQANAILAMTKAATVFINHLTNAANERTLSSNKKTIMPNDVFEALEDIEYPEFRDIVQQEFKKFNEVQSTKRNTYRRKVAAAKKGVPYVETPGLLREPRVPEATGPPGTTFIEDPAAAAGIDTSRSIKKQRMSSTHPANSSAMSGADADTTQEYQDAESEPDEPIDEESEDEVEPELYDDDEEPEDEGEGELYDEEEPQERELYDEQEPEDEDEALDNGEDSDS